jgi:site-specific DNA recombinase
MSGKSVMGYPETKRMLEDIRKGTISGIIFSKLARLARNTKELLEFSEIFNHEDADLISLQEAIDTSTPAGRLFYTMIAAMAQWEREEIADRVKASIPIRAQLGKSLGGYPPLGYKWNGNQLEIDEKTAPLRKLIYDLFLQHKRKKTVANILNEQGYRSQNGKPFTDTGIGHIIKDPVGKGQRRANYRKRVGGRKVFKPVEEWIFTPCPAIISPDIWEQCNRILDEATKKRKPIGPKAKHLLAGFVHCECEKKMYVFHQTKEPSYVCQACNNRIAENDLNEIYKEQLKSFLFVGTEPDAYAKRLDRELLEKVQLLELVLNEKVNIKKTIDGLIQMRANGEMTKAAFQDQYKPIEQRYQQILEQIPELQSAVDVITIQHQSAEVILQDAKDLYTKWDILDYQDKRHIVELITDTIIVGKEDIHIKLSYLPTAEPKSNPPAPQSSNSENGGKSKAPHCGAFLCVVY